MLGSWSRGGFAFWVTWKTRGDRLWHVLEPKRCLFFSHACLANRGLRTGFWRRTDNLNATCKIAWGNDHYERPKNLEDRPGAVAGCEKPVNYMMRSSLRFCTSHDSIISFTSYVTLSKALIAQIKTTCMLIPPYEGLETLGNFLGARRHHEVNVEPYWGRPRIQCLWWICFTCCDTKMCCSASSLPTLHGNPSPVRQNFRYSSILRPSQTVIVFANDWAYM